MTIENVNEENTVSSKSNDDPWEGFPDTSWVIDGYALDDAICDHILQSEGRYDGVRFASGKEALEHLLQELRARRFDAKVVADSDNDSEDK